MKYFIKVIDRKKQLCSRDIQAGDKFRFCGEDGVVSGEYLAISDEEKSDDYKINISVIGEYDFKVIGQVSPEAVWVKDGMEFNEEDVKRDILTKNVYSEYSHFHPKGTELFIIPDGEQLICERYMTFKCPTCKTFH